MLDRYAGYEKIQKTKSQKKSVTVVALFPDKKIPQTYTFTHFKVEFAAYFSYHKQHIYQMV